MRSGLSLGRWMGIEVRAHWSVVVISALLAVSLARDIGLVPAAVGVAAFLISILAHEFGHAMAARRFDIATSSIHLWALGGVAHLDRQANTARAEGWIAAAGPAVSMLLGVAGFGGWWLLGGPTSASTYVAVVGWLGLVNVVLAVFNLLPGAPLDGGRILKAVRWWHHGDRYRATREAASAGEVLAILLGAAGLVVMMRDSSGAWVVVTAAFLWVNAKVEHSSADLAEQLDGVTVGDLAWLGVAAAGTDMDADSMLWQRRRLGAAGGVSVTGPTGEPIGLVLERDLWAVPAHERSMVLLTQLMVPFERTARARPDEPLADVLPRLDPRSPVVTVWEGDRLIGMVPPDRLDQRLGW